MGEDYSGIISVFWLEMQRGITSSLIVFGVGLTMRVIEVYNKKQWCEPEQI